MHSSKVFLYFFTSIIFATSSLVACAFWNIPLFADGANWFFEFLRSKSLYYDYGFERYLDLVVQFPSYALLNLFDTSLSPGFYRIIWNLSYLLHPILSALVCWAVLKNDQDKSAKWIPLFGAATCTLPTIIFSVGVAPITLSFAWIAWALAVSEHRGKSNQVLVAVCMGLLLFSYETVFLLLLFFGLILFNKYRNTRERLFWAVFTLALSSGLVYLIASHSGPATDRFWASLPFSFSYWKIGCLLFIICLPLAGLSWFKKGFIHIGALAGIFYLLYRNFDTIELWSSYNFRTFSVPYTLALMGLYQFFGRSNQELVKKIGILVSYATVFSSCALAFGGAKWDRSVDEVRSAIRSHVGCVYKSYEAYGLTDLTVAKHFFTPLSIVIQNKWSVDPLLLSPIMEEDWKIEEPCRLVGRKIKINNMEFRFGESKTFRFPTIR